MDQKEFEYKLFETLLFEVRFELARSRLMDTNLDKMTAHLNEEFQKYDSKQCGLITITEIKKSLFNSKKANLTPFQVFNLIGMTNPDKMGMVKYAEFAPLCTQLIQELFSMESISKKAELIETKIYEAPTDLDSISISNLELFELFKKYDRNQNGFLEIHEYIQCLKDAKINLTD